MAKSKDFGLLYKFNYPPYQIVSCSNNSFAVCGGGGASKTGVPNKIEIFELSTIDGYDKLALPTFKIISSFDTNDKAIMSMRRHFNYLLTAEGSNLKEYIVQEKIDEAEQPCEGELVVKERHARESGSEKRVMTGEMELDTHRRLEPCFADEGVEVNVVRYGGRSGQLVLTGSSRGAVRIYQRYSDDTPMELVLQRELLDVTDGKYPVMELDVSPGEDEIVTVGGRPDGRYARIWSLIRGVKVTELALTRMTGRGGRKRDNVPVTGPPANVAYKFRQCRYTTGHLHDGRTVVLLYATHQPVAIDRTSPSFMSVWGPLDPSMGTDYQLIDLVSLGRNRPASFGARTSPMVPTALSVTDSSGMLSALGSGEGQVDVYRLDDRTHRLTRIYSLQQAHSFFVTDLTFLPSCRAAKSGLQFELVSVGVDNMLRYHRVVHRPSYVRLNGLYKLLSLLIVLFFCDRVLVLLGLF